MMRQVLAMQIWRNFRWRRFLLLLAIALVCFSIGCQWGEDVRGLLAPPPGRPVAAPKAPASPLPTSTARQTGLGPQRDEAALTEVIRFPA